MSLRRELLPDPLSYYAQVGVFLVGGGVKRTAKCPFHEDRRPSFLVNIEDGSFHCFGCAAHGRDVVDFERLRYGLSFVDAARSVGAWKDDRNHADPRVTLKPRTPNADTPRPTLATHWRDTWRNLRPISESPVADYLSARCCDLPRSHVRYASALRHPTGFVGPAMVALVTDAVTREPLTLHRTWINADGTKAEVDPPRLLLGKHRKQGGVVRLFPDDAVTTGLAIGEGIETMLTVALAFKPVWSAIDASNLAAFPVLDGIESLLIVADHDTAGLRAAEQCAERWYRAGREVRIAKSPTPGEDLNDHARRAA